MREEITSTIVTAGKQKISFTTSVRCALGTTSARALEDVIQRADTALYEAKTSERNCVTMDGVAAESRRTAA
ncbi:MAG: diguanylate cyclase [Alphaproteobacteria bacterium]|nr:MAG: diguanylate cyclase [Alphaproteobacteria bacterium]